MKSGLVAWGIAMSFGLLVAGGDVSPVAPISEPLSNCSPDEVYVEEDAQLMWQDQKYTDKEDGAYKKNRSYNKAGTWEHAVNYCKRLDYAGYTDWRLPTSDELSHIHRHPGQVFRYFRGDDFWSSTPTAEHKYNVVYPADGYQYQRKPSQSNYIRCVRCIAPAVQ